ADERGDAGGHEGVGPLVVQAHIGAEGEQELGGGAAAGASADDERGGAGEVERRHGVAKLEGGEAEEGAAQRSLRVARPMRASMKLRIQNRTTTLGSLQPLSSKWWWIGAILNTRLPVSLKETTCTITLTASSTKMPPTSTRVNSFFEATARKPMPAPSGKLPTS